MIEQEIRKWAEESFKDYCNQCGSACCNNSEYILTLTQEELVLFFELGIKKIDLTKVERQLVIDWTNGSSKPEEESIIETPALIELPTERRTWGLYNDGYCPFYDKKQGCNIHDNPRRPQACKDYPFSIVVPWMEPIMVYAHKRCSVVNSGEAVSDFKNKFPSIDIIVE